MRETHANRHAVLAVRHSSPHAPCCGAWGRSSIVALPTDGPSPGLSLGTGSVAGSLRVSFQAGYPMGSGVRRAKMVHGIVAVSATQPS